MSIFHSEEDQTSSLPVFFRHNGRGSFEDLEDRPYSFNAGGVKGIQARAIENTDPTVLAEHGGGDVFPLYFSPLAENGNYLEPEEVAVRKGVCGDPRLVRFSPECRPLFRPLWWCTCTLP